MDQEFEEFFQYLEKLATSEEEHRNILRPLKHLMWKQQLKRGLKIALILASICFAIYYIDSLNWLFCGVGRLVLIKILPLWNWRYLGKSKCLIEKAQVSSSATYSNNDVDELIASDSKDCRVCENFAHIDVVREAKYANLHDKYLIRGLPVIVGDTIQAPNNPSGGESLSSFIDNIFVNMSDMINSKACNLETNLMMSKYVNLDKVLTILRAVGGEDQFFVSFRNCKFKAVKASRLITQKPYFYPINLQAPYTTWLLMSQNYENYRNELRELEGLVIVTQMRGSIKVTLRVKRLCESFCKDLSVQLYAGESLVFFANLWTFQYEYVAESGSYSVTFITETNLH